MMTRPAETDYTSAYAGYIALVPEDDILSVIEEQSGETQRLITSIDETRAAFRYAEGKWSIKEVIGHLTDGERIFGSRILAIARGETQPLPGFDEQTYVANAGFDAWKLGDLAEHYALSRRANIVLLRNLPAEAWQRRGVANGAEITVCALAYTIVGHERHHLRVLRERYLV
jgi:hypothetical protein